MIEIIDEGGNAHGPFIVVCKDCGGGGWWESVTCPSCQGKGHILSPEPKGCPIPGACSCPTVGEPVAWSTPTKTGRQLTSFKDVADRWRANGAFVEELYVR